jgi:hypothetical protein
VRIRIPTTPDAAAALITSEMARMRKVIKAARIGAD